MIALHGRKRAYRRKASAPNLLLSPLLDTVIGGITIFVVIILPICSALTPKTETTIATSRPIAMTTLRQRHRGLTLIALTI
jgi:hypothetical protein